jgi:hypothetical protein
MALAGIQRAQAREGIEVLEEGLGQGGEAVAPTDVVELGREEVEGAVAMAGVEDAAALEVLDVPLELLAIEVRER